jgi:hypothetical protein
LELAAFPHWQHSPTIHASSHEPLKPSFPASFPFRRTFYHARSHLASATCQYIISLASSNSQTPFQFRSSCNIIAAPTAANARDVTRIALAPTNLVCL